MIFIDRPSTRVTRPSGKLYSHLFGDSRIELHHFAKQIGLKRHWFHHRKEAAHYDVPVEFIEAAIQAGARCLDSKECVSRLKPRKRTKGMRPCWSCASRFEEYVFVCIAGHHRKMHKECSDYYFGG